MFCVTSGYYSRRLRSDWRSTRGLWLACGGLKTAGSPSNLQLRDRGESPQRGPTSAQLSQFLFAEFFGAACHYPRSARDECPAELRVGRRDGDIAKGAQQSQADGHVRLRIHADLVKG